VGPDGRLPRKPEQGLADADPAEILAEARAQLARFRALAGRPPTHVDSHHHAHRLENVFEALVLLAREADLPVRAGSPPLLERLLRAGLRSTDGFVEAFYDAGATLATLQAAIAELGAGTTELMCHPGEPDDDELRQGSSYAARRADEVLVLTSPEARRAVVAARVELIHFGEL
jgi:hypothetical protein